MRKKFLLSWLFLAVFIWAGAAQAIVPDAPKLLGDINTGLVDEYAENFTPVNGQFVFTRRDDDHGMELWVTSDDGVKLLKDINPGVSSSNPSQLFPVETSFGEQVLFQARSADEGVELWSTDGTPEGTVLLKDIASGISSSYPQQFFFYATEKLVLFNASNGSNGYELWATDGSSEGTKMIFDINPGIGNSSPLGFTLTPGGIAFSARSAAPVNAYDEELWLLSLDLDSVEKVADLNDSDLGSLPRDLHWNNELGLLFFACIIDGKGQELCASDLTEGGTGLVKDIFAGTTGSEPKEIRSVSGGVVFIARDGTVGQEIWFSDGTEGGTYNLKDIKSGGATSRPEAMTQLDDIVLFVANSSSSVGEELWRTDGTAAGTVLVKDIANGAFSSSPSELIVFNKKVYFSAFHLESRTELWMSDGTEGGTQIVTDLNTYTSSSPAELSAGDDALVFIAKNPHRALYKIDSNNVLLKIDDIVGPGTEDADPVLVASIGDIVFLSADSAEYGQELWLSVGNAEPVLVKDICPGRCNGLSSDSTFVVLGEKLFFGADDGELSGEELWVSDGTAAGTTLFIDFIGGLTGGSPEHLTPLGDGFVFKVDTDEYGEELWKSDGTVGGTTLLKDIAEGSDGSSPYSFAAFGELVIFSAYSQQFGYELWKTDGTAAGTTLIKDINPGTVSSNLGDIFVAGDLAYFQATTTAAGSELWVTDGTSAGTKLVKDLASGTEGSNIYSIMPFGSKVLFDADLPEIGREIWVSDGTSAGTVLLGDFTPGEDSSSFLSDRSCAFSDDMILFTLSSEGFNRQLWTSDGTAAGTEVFTELYPGENAEIYSMNMYEDTCYFTAYDDDISDYVMWQSDGTVAGTVRIPLPLDMPSLDFEEFYFANGHAYFQAEAVFEGTELYYMLIDECPLDPDKKEAGACGCGLSDDDSDGDGMLDCNDQCAFDPLKEVSGLCGCGVADTDTDGDGAPDCTDLCVADPEKTAPGACGCGIADADADGSGTADCLVADEFSGRITALQDAVNALKPLKKKAKKKRKKKARRLRKAAKQALTDFDAYFSANSLSLASNDGTDLGKLHTKVKKKVRKSLKIQAKKFRRFKNQAKKAVAQLLASIG